MDSWPVHLPLRSSRKMSSISAELTNVRVLTTSVFSRTIWIDAVLIGS